MALTRDFKDLVKQRADRDPEFRRGLVIYAMEAFLDNDLNTCKASLRTYVKATIGFEKFGKELGKQPTSLRGMLSESRNPLANNLVAIICFLKKREGIERVCFPYCGKFCYKTALIWCLRSFSG